jgi:sugar lactone lactonase YvrE
MKKIIFFSLIIISVIISAFSGKQKPSAETWTVLTIAGWEEKDQTIDGKGQKASFTWQVNNSVIDAGDNLYVIDQVCLRKMDNELNVTTMFGMGAFDAEGNSLKIKQLPGKDGICIDKDNNIYVSERSTHMIYKIKPDKTVEPFAGDEGYKGKDDGAKSEAAFNGPTALCIDKTGNIYVADTYNSSIRKISVDGKVTTVAGNGQIGDFKTGAGKAAQFLEFRAIAVDGKGNIYISQNGRGSCVAKISPTGVVTNFVGDADALTPTGANHDATGKAARFNKIQALTVDKDDNLIIGENTRIRKATPAGVVTTLAGSEESDWRDAAGAKARFRSVNGLSIDSKGNILVSDQYCIRKMTKQ